MCNPILQKLLRRATKSSKSKNEGRSANFSQAGYFGKEAGLVPILGLEANFGFHPYSAEAEDNFLEGRISGRQTLSTTCTVPLRFQKQSGQQLPAGFARLRSGYWHVRHLSKLESLRVKMKTL